MKNYQRLLVAVLFACLAALPAYSQAGGISSSENSSQAPGDSTSQDSTKKDDFESWGDNYHSARGFHFGNMGDFSFKFSMPSISFQAFESAPIWNDKRLDRDFAQLRGWDLKIGYNDFQPVGTSSYLLESSYDFVHLTNINRDFLKPDKKANETGYDAWSFGFGGNEGYGYKYGKVADLVLYHGSGLGWTNVNFTNSTATAADMKKLKRIDDTWRYSENFEVGANLRFGEMVGVSFAFQRTLVYPRHLFWYWSLSKLIEAAGQGLVGSFVDAVGERVPYVLPVMNVALRSALSWGLYQLRSRDMNWPVNTEPGFIFDNFKVGASVSF